MREEWKDRKIMRVRVLARNLAKLFWRKLVEAFMEPEDVDRELCQVAGATLADALRSQGCCTAHCLISTLPSRNNLKHSIHCQIGPGQDISAYHRTFPNRTGKIRSEPKCNVLWNISIEGRPKADENIKFGLFCNYIHPRMIFIW